MFLDFFDLVAESKINFEVGFNFIDTMHYGSVIFDANFGGDFGGTHGEFFTEYIHGNLASSFNVADAGFAAHLFD